jgi:hypothetical protein
MRVIRTTNGTGVEEYDDLEGPSLLKKTLGLQNKHHSRMYIPLSISFHISLSLVLAHWHIQRSFLFYPSVKLFQGFLRPMCPKLW